MTTYDEVLSAVQTLPVSEKVRLLEAISAAVRRDLDVAAFQKMDWHEFIDRTAGSLANDPIQRWEQGAYEEREPLE